MDDKPEQEPSRGPSTLGGHASHTGGAWLIVLALVVLLVWLFSR